MMTAGTLGLLIGMVLGQRFKFSVLVPAIGFALLATIVVGVARAEDAWWMVALGALLSAALQIGYFIGVAIRISRAAARRARWHGGQGLEPTGSRPKTATLFVIEPSKGPRKSFGH